jgi:GNAT superfamily N-acetyltransferase
MIVIERIDTLPIEKLSALVTEADANGFRALSRLVEDWRSGLNRFDQSGEAFFIATNGGRVIGVCGLNHDPYISVSTVGRVRHLYVAADHRRKGIGTQLVRAVVAAAHGHFVRLRLRTDSADANAFYRSIGFMPATGEPACSHQLVFHQWGSVWCTF